MVNQLWSTQQRLYRQCLKQIRLQVSLTQKDLAILLGKPQSYVSKYESGERKLDYLEVREICRSCGVSMTEFENMLAATGLTRSDS